MKTKNIILILVIVILVGVLAVWLRQNKSDDSSQYVTAQPNVEDISPKTYTVGEVAEHNSQSSCWSIVRGSVYDLTSWISLHPGGASKILAICGRDGTEAFVGKHGGSQKQEDVLASFLIGEVSN